MPLSEYEQRMLAQMEEQLHADDPRLAETLGERARPDVRNLLLGSLIALAGLGGLVAGVATGWIWLGVLGFVAMVAGVLIGIRTSSSTSKSAGSPGAGPGGRGGSGGSRRAPSPSGGAVKDTKSFMERQQQRWEQRGEGRGA